jgi:LacI family fructose operon transcriptional repressor
MPFVIIDRTVKTDKADMVLLDNISAGYELASHLIENGYCKLAGLFGNASTTGKDRQRGFQNALKEHDLNPIAVHFIEPRIKHGYAMTMELLAQAERPDAIFTSNSLLTAGAFQAIRDCGLAIPNEIALVGFDETTWGTLVAPPITLIAQPTEEIGLTATELLFQRINEPKRSPKTVILKGKLLVRGSSAAQ